MKYYNKYYIIKYYNKILFRRSIRIWQLSPKCFVGALQKWKKEILKNVMQSKVCVKLKQNAAETIKKKIKKAFNN